MSRRFIKDDPYREADRLFEIFWRKEPSDDSKEHDALMAADPEDLAYKRAEAKDLLNKWGVKWL